MPEKGQGPVTCSPVPFLWTAAFYLINRTLSSKVDVKSVSESELYTSSPPLKISLLAIILPFTVCAPLLNITVPLGA